MPIVPSIRPASRAAVLAALLVAAAVGACGDRAEGAEGGAEAGTDEFGMKEQTRVEVDPCALLTNAEISEQLARSITPSERSSWSTLEFEITPTEVEWGISRRCDYKFQSRAMVGGGPVWHSDFSVMVVHAAGTNVPEHVLRPLESAPDIRRELHTKAYYINKGDLAASLTSFPGSQEGDESDEDATRIVLLRRMAERLP
jgi:hypothetical protein